MAFSTKKVSFGARSQQNDIIAKNSTKLESSEYVRAQNKFMKSLEEDYFKNVSIQIYSTEDLDLTNAYNITKAFKNSDPPEMINDPNLSIENAFNTVRDYRLGATMHMPCMTCHLPLAGCPGHLGKVILNDPIIHPLYGDEVAIILTCICWSCSQLLISDEELKKYKLLPSVKDRRKALMQYSKNITDCKKGYERNLIGLAGEIIHKYLDDIKIPKGHGRDNFTKLFSEYFKEYIKEEYIKETYINIEEKKIQPSSEEKKEKKSEMMLEKLLAAFPGDSHNIKSITIPNIINLFEIRYHENARLEVWQKSSVCSQNNRINLKFDPDTGYINYSIRQDAVAKKGDKVSAKIAASQALKSFSIPSEIYEIFKQIPEEDAKILGFSGTGKNSGVSGFIGMHPKFLIIHEWPVISTIARPFVDRGNGLVAPAMTIIYDEIVDINNKIVRRKINDKPISDQKAESNKDNLKKLRIAIIRLIDPKAARTVTGMSNDATGIIRGDDYGGLIESFQGKKGILRKNIQGKNVQNVVRTVIGPGPDLALGEISIPQIYVRQLSKRIFITDYNIEVVTEMLRDGQIIRIYRNERSFEVNNYFRSRGKIELGDVAERILLEGDVILANRQPSLHRYSFQAARVRLTDKNNIAINMSTTTPYGADFDGDEMNMHAPQTLDAQVEANILFDVSECSMDPKYARPLMGLVYNIPLSVYILVNPDPGKIIKISPGLWYDLLEIIRNSILGPGLETLEKRLNKFGLKPFTGRALFSALLPSDFNYKRNDIRIEEGILLDGKIKGSNIGRSLNSIIQVLDINYPPEILEAFNTNTQRVTNKWIESYGMSIGYQDCLVDKEFFDDIQYGIIMGFRNDLENVFKRFVDPIDTTVKIEYKVNQVLESILDPNFPTSSPNREFSLHLKNVFSELTKIFFSWLIITSNASNDEYSPDPITMGWLRYVGYFNSHGPKGDYRFPERELITFLKGERPDKILHLYPNNPSGFCARFASTPGYEEFFSDRTIQREKMGLFVFSSLLPPDLSIDKFIVNGVAIRPFEPNDMLSILSFFESHSTLTLFSFLADLVFAAIRWFNLGMMSQGKNAEYIESEKRKIRALASALGDIPKDRIELVEYEKRMTSILADSSQIGKELVRISGDSNGFVLTATAGSKGTPLNLGQIQGMQGQQYKNGKRMQRKSFTDRCSPFFAEGDYSPEAFGFCPSSMTRGLKLPESIFHSVGSRGSQIDNATGTAKSGNVAHLANKLMENVVTNSFGSVVFGGKIVQPVYGDIGMHPTRMRMINGSDGLGSYVSFVDVVELANRINEEFMSSLTFL